MSDTSSGPGWWMASDGKWYPPHLHPSNQPAQPAAPLPSVQAAPPFQPAAPFAPAQAAPPFQPAAPFQPAEAAPPFQPAAPFQPAQPLPPYGVTPPVQPDGRYGTANPAAPFASAQPSAPSAPSQPADPYWVAQPIPPADPYGMAPATDPPASKRVRRPLLVGMTIVLVLAVAAGVLVAVLGSGSGSNADAAIIRAVNSAIGDKSAHVTANSTIEVGGRSITETGSGSVDFTDNALDLNITGSADGQQISVEAIYLAGTIYEHLPQIAEIAPGKNWISLDLSSLTQQAGEGGTGGLSGNPLATLHALALQGNTVNPLGASTIDGQSVQGYSVTFNPAVVQGEIGSADLPDWMKQVVSQIKVNGGSEQVYLANDGSLVREAVTMDERVGSAGVVNIDASYDFSDYGTPVTISAPPADQVVSISQFLQLAGGSTTA